MAAQPESSDLQLVQATLAGDLAAYRTLVERHELRVFRFLLKHVAQVEEAEDLSQETFLQAYRSLASYRCEAHFTTWLTGIALNLTRNYHNRSRCPAATQGVSNELENLPADTAIPIDDIERLELIRAAQRAIGDLPAAQRDCVVLIILSGLGYEEASRILRVPIGTIKSRLARAREKLAEVLKDY